MNIPTDCIFPLSAILHSLYLVFQRIVNWYPRWNRLLSFKFRKIIGKVVWEIFLLVWHHQMISFSQLLFSLFLSPPFCKRNLLLFFPSQKGEKVKSCRIVKERKQAKPKNACSSTSMVLFWFNQTWIRKFPSMVFGGLHAPIPNKMISNTVGITTMLGPIFWLTILWENMDYTYIILILLKNHKKRTTWYYICRPFYMPNNIIAYWNISRFLFIKFIC